MNAAQALFDSMKAEWQKARAETQMTLGGLIEALAQMPGDTQVAALCHAHSYRGYYEDIAFDCEENATRPAAELLAECREAMGRVFTGYKGGHYMMGETTPVWIAEYGSCGERLIAIGDDGTTTTEEDE